MRNNLALKLLLEPPPNIISHRLLIQNITTIPPKTRHLILGTAIVLGELVQRALLVLDGSLGDGGGSIDFVAFGFYRAAHFVLDVDGGAEVEFVGEGGGGDVIVGGGGGGCR
mmetsp:Transcript_19787/g.28189  ORF Transcript_19787/g.28189 Transcript_19787/m.28189 type:complete len:112 (+) Transcript_19787:1689-2024(+)